MSSIALQILDKMETQLKKASLPGWDGEVFTRPLNLTVGREIAGLITERMLTQGPVISLRKGGELPTKRTHHQSPMNIHVLEAEITVAVLAESTSASAALDAPSSWVVQALQSDPTLGGFAHYISEEGSDDDHTPYQESEKILAARHMKFHVRFHTRTDNPDARS